jgi:hypothetical protein
MVRVPYYRRPAISGDRSQDTNMFNYHYIDQLPDAEKLPTLAQLYLQLNLPLENALRAAEADLCHIADQ